MNNLPDRKQAPNYKTIDYYPIQKAEFTSLKNGTDVYFINSGKEPVLRLEVIFKAGRWFESIPGSALFTIEMLREGSKNKTAHQISESFDQYGAYLELQHGLDFSVAHLYTLSKHLEKLLPVFTELLFEPVFPERELEILKNIKIQNTKINCEKNSFVASRKIREMLFGNQHPYGYDVYEKEISHIAQNHLTDFYRENFSDFFIIASGKIDDNVIKLINDFFGGVSKLQITKEPSYPLNPTPQKRIFEKGRDLQSSIRLASPIISKTHPDYLKLRVTNELLGGFFGSRLMKNIREDKGYTYGIHSSLVNFKNHSYFLIGADVKAEFKEQAIEEVLNEIELLKSEKVSFEELETVKNYMVGSFIGSLNTPFDLAEKFKAIFMHGLSYDYYDNFFKTINTITPDDILEIANKYFNSEIIKEVAVGG